MGASFNGTGVGDDKSSWAYDGKRKLMWAKGGKPWGGSWKSGSVVGVAADVDTGTLMFCLDGSWDAPMGTAFRYVCKAWCLVRCELTCDALGASGECTSSED